MISDKNSWKHTYVHCFFASQRPPHCVMRRRRGCSRKMRKLCYQGNSLRGIVNCSGVARKVQNILLDNTLSQACLITIFSLLQHETKNSFYKQCWPSMVFHSENNSYLWKVLLDQRPKFYRRSRRFKTYGYGYGGQSLRPFLRPKVLFVVFLVFFQNGGWYVFFITQVPP